MWVIFSIIIYRIESVQSHLRRIYVTMYIFPKGDIVVFFKRYFPIFIYVIIWHLSLCTVHNMSACVRMNYTLMSVFTFQIRVLPIS